MYRTSEFALKYERAAAFHAGNARGFEVSSFERLPVSVETSGRPNRVVLEPLEGRKSNGDWEEDEYDEEEEEELDEQEGLSSFFIGEDESIVSDITFRLIT